MCWLENSPATTSTSGIFTFYFMYNDQLGEADYALYLEVYSAIHTTVYLSAFGRGMVHPN